MKIQILTEIVKNELIKTFTKTYLPKERLTTNLAALAPSENKFQDRLDIFCVQKAANYVNIKKTTAVLLLLQSKYIVCLEH